MTGVVAGSALTLVGGVLQGRANDRSQAAQLTHDRAEAETQRRWNLRLQNIEDRRQLYADLIHTATELADALAPLVASLSLSKDPEVQRSDRQRSLDRADALRGEFQRKVAQTDVMAVDRAVIEHATELHQEAVAMIRDRYLSQTDRLRSRYDKVSDELLPSLRDACRRDLGLDIGEATTEH